MTITPNWWNHYQLWYLDIAARNVRATEGVMGVIWLPALPDGTPMGPKPRSLRQRYVDLYDNFENAWRVSDANTLFDYAPGTSTETFTIDGWPAENPQTCMAPARLAGGPAAVAPQKALAREAAQQHCGGVARDATRANCIQDVMATGEPSFAQNYIRAEQIERNALPAAPSLSSPEGFKTDLAAPVDFTWNSTSDSNNDAVMYKHCVWEVKERFTFDKCMATAAVAPAQTTSWRSGLPYALLVLLLGCLLLAVLLWLGLKKNPALLAVLVVAILAGVFLALYLGRTQTSSAQLAKTVPGLESGKSYYWKVIAEDGKGGTVESETRRFTIK